MTAISFSSFSDELEKIASGSGAAVAELAGLGILARPAVKELRGKHMSEKSKNIHEVVGLGVLGVPAALELGAKGIRALKRYR